MLNVQIDSIDRKKRSVAIKRSESNKVKNYSITENNILFTKNSIIIIKEKKPNRKPYKQKSRRRTFHHKRSHPKP